MTTQTRGLIGSEARILPENVRGTCPMCARRVVSNVYWRGGYVIVWECEGALAEKPVCDYERVVG
jgi:hypothetical protein